jgi:hypothetical protein
MAAGVAHGLLALGIGSANAVGDATAADTDSAPRGYPEFGITAWRAMAGLRRRRVAEAHRLANVRASTVGERVAGISFATLVELTGGSDRLASTGT